MSQQIINVGTAPNDGLGTPIRTAFQYTNNNFTQLFSLPNPTPPSTLVGKAGDVPGMYAFSSAYFYYCFGTYDGTTIIWAQIVQGNTSSVTRIVNGTSNVTIGSANANVAISVAGSSNVAVFSTAGVVMSGNANALNIYASGVITANGNVTGANLKTSGSVSATGDVTANNVITIGNISVTGNITANTMCAVGNIRANNFRTIGNISASGNVYGNIIISNYLYGDGSNISNISGGGSYSNANVDAYLPTYSGNLTANFISASSNVSVGNLLTGGQISAVANISGNYFIGNGSLLTGVADYSNSDVATYLANSNVIISTTGNITGSYILGNGSQLTGIAATGINANALAGSILSSNVTTSSLTSVGTLANLSVTGNVVASGVVTSTGTFRLPSFTTAQIANISAVEGDMVYNSTVQQIQAYQANATGNVTWVSLSVSTYQ